MRSKETVARSARVEGAVDVEEGVSFVHGCAVAVEGCDCAVFEEIADIEEFVELEAVLLAMLRVGRYIVKLSESTGEFYMAKVVETCVAEGDYAILRHY